MREKIEIFLKECEMREKVDIQPIVMGNVGTMNFC